MNVIIYKISNNLQELLNKLEDIEEISISFAMDEKKLVNFINQVNPEIVFMNVDETPRFFDTLFLGSTKLSIYTIDDSLPQLELTDYKSNDLVLSENTDFMLFLDE